MKLQAKMYQLIEKFQKFKEKGKKYQLKSLDVARIFNTNSTFSQQIEIFSKV